MKGGKPLRIQLRHEYQEVPWPGGPDDTLGIKALISPQRVRGRYPRLLRPKKALLFEGQPSRCLRRVPFRPPGPDRGGHTIISKPYIDTNPVINQPIKLSK